MKRVLAIVAIIVSIPLLVLGVIFLIAAATNPNRFFVAVVFLLFGGALLVWGALTLRRLAEISPEALATGIVDLARRLGGEVTAAQVQAEFRISKDLALNVLEKLRGRGECQRERRADHDVYLFKGVMPAKAIKRCPYCGSEFAVKSALRECPNCGAVLEIVKE
nr:TFIIB-type zinc ribbon-containing protein [Chloroflexota bacterium]